MSRSIESRNGDDRMVQVPYRLLNLLAQVHRGWCNYCKGDTLACETCPAGGCTLRDVAAAMRKVSEKQDMQPSLPGGQGPCGPTHGSTGSNPVGCAGTPSAVVASGSAAEIDAELKEVEDAIFSATGSALLSGEKHGAADKSIIYRSLCAAGNTVASVRETLRQQSAIQDTWRDPKDKPPHLPGEHHSEPVLILMEERGYVDRDWGRIKIGHVSCGHWRPAGGNGNFDDDVIGWMPLPVAPTDSEGRTDG